MQVTINSRREELIDSIKALSVGGKLTEAVANRIAGALAELDDLPRAIQEIKSDNAKRLKSA
ncbi:MAG: hypothetical protein GY861_08330 [bacterium]|nr:hypothetical protein [bacterium]